jgi:hypothetical protein
MERAGGVAQVVEHLPSKSKTEFNTPKKKKKKKKASLPLLIQLLETSKN